MVEMFSPAVQGLGFGGEDGAIRVLDVVGLELMSGLHLPQQAVHSLLILAAGCIFKLVCHIRPVCLLVSLECSIAHSIQAAVLRHVPGESC